MQNGKDKLYMLSQSKIELETLKKIVSQLVILLLFKLQTEHSTEKKESKIKKTRHKLTFEKQILWRPVNYVKIWNGC